MSVPPLRVLTVSPDLGPGGTQRVAQNYAIGYAQAGHASAVLGYMGSGPRADELRREDVDVFAGTSTAVSDAVAWAPDVVHVHRGGDPFPPITPVLQRLAAGCPEATFVETSVFARADPSETGALFDVHLQLTRWCMWKWRKWSRGIRPEPVGVVVPYAIDPSAFYPDAEAGRAFRHEHGIPADAVVYGRIGQPDEAKWMPELVDSFGEVAAGHEDAFLLLVGPSPSVRESVRALPAPVGSRVRIVDFLHGDEALRAAYSAMDVFVLAARIGESFGMVLVEAMLCGVPVVARSRPARDNSQVEVVGHESGGLVVADARATTRAMERLHRDPALRSQLGAGGRERVLSRYSTDVVLPWLLRVVEAAVEAPTREALRGWLRETPEAITRVSDEEIEALMEQAIGRPSGLERLVMVASHEPRLFRAWRRIRGWLR